MSERDDLWSELLVLAGGDRAASSGLRDAILFAYILRKIEDTSYRRAAEVMSQQKQNKFRTMLEERLVNLVEMLMETGVQYFMSTRIGSPTTTSSGGSPRKMPVVDIE